MTASDDPLFAHRVRAGVLAFLSSASAADFTALAEALEVPNNTLSGHLQRLEAEGVIELRRGFLGRKPRTRVHLTPAGWRRWALYLEGLG